MMALHRSNVMMSVRVSTFNPFEDESGNLSFRKRGRGHLLAGWLSLASKCTLIMPMRRTLNEQRDFETTLKKATFLCYNTATFFFGLGLVFRS